MDYYIYDEKLQEFPVFQAGGYLLSLGRILNCDYEVLIINVLCLCIVFVWSISTPVLKNEG